MPRVRGILMRPTTNKRSKKMNYEELNQKVESLVFKEVSKLEIPISEAIYNIGEICGEIPLNNEDITKDVIEEVEDIKVYLRSIEDSLRILREIKQKIKGAKK
jgi:hypothetical protein